MARPVKNITPSEFKRYVLRGHNQAEVCNHFGITDKTLMAWIKRTYSVDKFKDCVLFIKAGVI